jgi:hypothetical protein
LPLRQRAPPALPRWAHSRCHHRFCGLCRLGRRREAKSATGLKEPLDRSRPTASCAHNATRGGRKGSGVPPTPVPTSVPGTETRA